jgi:hypothetical protein
MTARKNVLAVDRNQAIRNLLRSTMLRACVSCAVPRASRAPGHVERGAIPIVLPELRRLIEPRARVVGRRVEMRTAVRTSSPIARAALR